MTWSKLPLVLLLTLGAYKAFAEVYDAPSLTLVPQKIEIQEIKKSEWDSQYSAESSSPDRAVASEKKDGLDNRRDPSSSPTVNGNKVQAWPYSESEESEATMP